MDIESLFAETLMGAYDDDAPWEAVNKLRSLGSREVFDKAASWCRSQSPLQRARGADVLAQLGKTIDHRFNSFPEESFAVVAELVENEKLPEPLGSGIHALGHIGESRAVPIIMRYRSHSDSSVRFAVACACGSYPNEKLSVDTLLELMRDEDDDVRDWATFGLGTCSKADNPQIRDALFHALSDSCEDASSEALVGLANRHDRRALPELLARLQKPDVDYYTSEAACEMLGDCDVPETWTPTDYIEALRARFVGDTQ
jgi:HEAT repeat protein